MRVTLCIAALLMSAALASAQTAPPAASPTTPAPAVASATPAARPAQLASDIPDAALEIRASQAFNKGDYVQALPMLKKLEQDLKTDSAQADKVAMIQEQIRVCEKNKSGVTSVGSTDATPATAEKKEAARTPHPAPKEGEVVDLQIKELGNFEFDSENGSPIPDDVKALNGATIRLHGYMIPMDAAENISKFALVPSLFNCCYGQPPQVQHTIVVSCPKGKAVSYYPDEIIVQGKLTVSVEKDSGYIVSIFSIETSSVKPAPK